MPHYHQEEVVLKSDTIIENILILLILLTIFGHGLSNGDKKAIKDLYFRCVDVKYDKSSGRIITLYFNEITKVED